MMSANWKKEFRKEIESPNTPPEEAEKLAVTLLHFARRGDAGAERELICARLARKHAGLPPIRAIEHWIDCALALRAIHGKEASLDLCFHPDTPKSAEKLNKLSGLDKFRKWGKDQDVINTVNQAKNDGYPLTHPDMSKRETAFDKASDDLLKIGIGLSPYAVMDRYYGHKNRRR